MREYKEKMEPPTHLEPEYLFHKYKPLRQATYKKYQTWMQNDQDKEELRNHIDYQFILLVQEYNPNLDVDFPFYIKKMLDFRTNHFTTKYTTLLSRETYVDDEIRIPDSDFEEITNRILDIYSINPDINLGEKHRNLLIGLLIERKSLKELADEEGVPLDTIHARFYFLKAKLQREQRMREGGKHGGSI